MAALWVLVGVVAGGLIVYVAMTWGREAARVQRGEEMRRVLMDWEAHHQPRPDEPREHRPLLSDELQAKLVERLLDASLPARETVVDEPPPGNEPEYEPPPVEVQDWTDPFFGLERQMVGGLAPGQAIPGIGPDGGPFADHDPLSHEEQMEWLADHPQARGFEEVGEDLFEEWEGTRDG